MTREEVSPERIADATVVVIDTFLATTTLLTIFENGARRVFPVDSLEEAAEIGASLPETPIYGGEQDARDIEGYDCGPLPEEYPPSLVSGRDVIFVTTNGTRALSAAATARELLVGCLRNAPAVADYLLRADPEKLYVVCAGSGGHFTLEDFLGAVEITSRLDPSGVNSGARLNDAARLALDSAQRLGDDPLGALRESRAGRWFAGNDREETLRFVGDVGASGLVPAVRDGSLFRLDSGSPQEPRPAPERS
ncbi:2-phosphosulfolactate phosphatase [Rubrobacter aplysinae]|uniref:2-phosphosulfolactate phosphatase n=1 Tax=Rubrobacter aplysinae TaxID=909625 RepID=UPI00069D1216|nr:2-phosphosulfolactate phosphatase [Rubrobacter aplysinae]